MTDKIWMIVIFDVKDTKIPHCNYIFIEVSLPIDMSEIYENLEERGMTREQIRDCKLYTANFWGNGSMLLDVTRK